LIFYFSKPIVTNITNRLECEVAYNTDKAHS